MTDATTSAATILVVDDSPTTIDLLARILEDAGFEVETHRDLAETADPETPWYLPLTGKASRSTL